ncbi:MAG: septum formation protein Maf [Clostridia bacterium]|nr:septum formation protein Maf [Clostridia bacterium]
MKKHYVLASKSPRRSEILQNLGIPFEIVTAQTDESSEIRDPAKLVEVLSRRKGEAVLSLLREQGRDLSDVVILSSDTVVALDGQILGKPHDRADAERMLRTLSGERHQVISGICLLSEHGVGVAHEITEVLFDEIPEASLARYLDSDEPYDKAGAYAIQGRASGWIRGIRGCYFNVVGLPVHRLNILHREIFGENLL